MVFEKGAEPATVLPHSLGDRIEIPESGKGGNDWVGTAARDAYKSGPQLALDNGSRVVVGPDGVPRITVTPGLLLQMGPLGKDLKPGDQIIFAPTPPKA